MTGEEMLQEIERREYYAERERKNAELLEHWAYMTVLLIAGGTGWWLAGHFHLWEHVKALWRAFNPL